MKKFLYVLIALVIGIIGGAYAYNYFFHGNINLPFEKREVTLKNYKEPFMWGVNVNPSTVRKYSLEMWAKQMKIVKDLGTGWVRVGYDYNAADRVKMYNDMIANDQGINILLVLEPTKDAEKLSDPYDEGYKEAKEAASNFKGKIKYYQLLNELGGATVKDPSLTGTKESDIDETKYQARKLWIQGASKAIRETDPKAYIALDSFWTHYAVIDKLVKDKIDFDILGWNWYSDMKLLKDKKLDDGTLLVDKLKSYNKPIVLMEVNQVLKSNGSLDEEAQSQFIQDMGDWAATTDYIKGFFVYPLLDSPPTATSKANYLGIVSFSKAKDGGYTFGDTKPAFETYQKLIKKYTKAK